MVQRLLLRGLLLFAPLATTAQTLLSTDTYNGGIVVGTFSIGDQTQGIGALFMDLPAGATVRRATLYAVTIGGQPDASVSITLGSIPVTFDASTAGPAFGCAYGAAVLHSVDLTAVLDPAIDVYTLTILGGLTTFKEYMLFTEYELVGAGPITVDVFHCGLDSQLEENYTMHTTLPMSTDAPIAFGTMGAYALSPWTDYETVTVNGTELGKFHGPDPNAGAGNFFGACATFHYANGTFEGVSGDDPDQAIAGADVLSDLSGLITHGDQQFQVTYRHNPTLMELQQRDNLVNMVVVAYSGLPCWPVADLLGPDTTLCPGETLLLDATRNDAQYLWQDGSTSPTFLVTEPGTYHVQWLHPECTWTPDTVVVSYVTEPDLGLGADRLLCAGDSAVIGGTPLPGAIYSWSDGPTDMPRTVDSTGTYTLTALVNGCSFSGIVTIVTRDCGQGVELPNVFTPNGDGDNDVFSPISLQGVDRLSFTVYNRWGQSVFTTARPALGWDGRTPSGSLVPEGVYFWVLEYGFASEPGSTRTDHGTVTLLR